MDRRPLPLSFRPLWLHLSIVGIFAAFGVFAYFATFGVFTYLGFLHYLSREIELKIELLGIVLVALGWVLQVLGEGRWGGVVAEVFGGSLGVFGGSLGGLERVLVGSWGVLGVFWGAMRAS